tara:strand:- start:374 stop:604 length:231 start_codon:yes stop_codon:yes gene_type:complete
MHIDTDIDNNLDEIWKLILSKLEPLQLDICPNSSSFFKTNDGIECSLRKSNGELMATCYREKNKMGGFRWSIEICN